jgi:uncharacterized protein
MTMMSEMPIGAVAVATDDIVEPGAYWMRRLPANSMIRIVDLQGQQAVDFLCYDAMDLSDSYNAGNTIKLNKSIYLSKGSVLYSNQARRLMTIVEDTVGHHDTIAGCCSAPMNRLRYNVDGTANCRDTFRRALANVGAEARDIPANVNFFMNVPVDSSGRVEIAEGLSKAGDHVDLRCDTEVLAILSNCAQENNPCAGEHPTPIRVMTWSD